MLTEDPNSCECYRTLTGIDDLNTFYKFILYYYYLKYDDLNESE